MINADEARFHNLPDPQALPAYLASVLYNALQDASNERSFTKLFPPVDYISLEDTYYSEEFADETKLNMLWDIAVQMVQPQCSKKILLKLNKVREKEVKIEIYLSSV